MAALNANAVVGALGGSVRFGNLEFAVSGVGGRRYVPSFNPNQVICFGSLMFVADKLGCLHLNGAGDKARAVPIPPAEGSTVAEGGTLAVDLNALMVRINARLGPEPELEECWRTFYALASVLSQLSEDNPVPPENGFWDPSVPLPYGLRNAATLFELEIAERMRQASCSHPEFVRTADYAPTSVHDLLEGESCSSSSESSLGEDSHPSWQCNMVHAMGVDPTGGQAMTLPTL
jgi:hypothetical protein